MTDADDLLKKMVPRIRVIKLGTSSAIIIPKHLAKATGFAVGTVLEVVEISVDGIKLRRVPREVKTVEVREVKKS